MPDRAPTVLVRTDATGAIGMGHVARCLTLARALRSRGASVSFVGIGLEGVGVAAAGFEIIPVSGDEYRLSPAADATALETHLAGDSKTSVVVVDHYGLDAEWEAAIRDVGPRIVVIDDLADRPHECDLLLDQNLYDNAEHRYSGLVPDHCRLLLGPRWALLRPEFEAAASAVAPRETVKRVLISYGGADPTGETEKALRAALAVGSLQVIDVVVGPMFAETGTLRRLAASDSRCSVHERPADMASLMIAADLSLGAGGSTSWERCVLGLPTIVTTVAENQVEAARTLERHGAILYVGHADRVSSEEVGKAVSSLVRDDRRVSHMSRNARAVIGDDFAGAAGVADAILEVACGAS